MFSRILESLRLQQLGGAFGDHIAALPMSAAIDEDQHLPGLDPAKRLLRIIAFPREANQSTSIGAPISSGLNPASSAPGNGAIGADGQTRADRQGAGRGCRGDAHDPVLLHKKAIGLRAHQQPEARITLGLSCDKIQKSHCA